MSKIDELKQLLIKTTPDNPAYERIKIVLEAFFGLRQEYIARVSTEVYKKYNLEQVLMETVEARIPKKGESNEDFEKRVNEGGDNYNKLRAKADKEVLDQVNNTIEQMLTNHENIRKLNALGQGHHDLLENLSKDYAEVSDYHQGV